MMKIEAESPEVYIEKVPEDRREYFRKLRSCILDNLPDGFQEMMSYGMIGYLVPHSIYPSGYHCDSKLPLPFINIASQKNFIALYHMGIYAQPELLEWFVSEWESRDLGRLDMGKSCIRFKKPENIPFELIGELASKLSVEDWINLYESKLKR